MKFLKNIYKWLFKRNYKGFLVVKITEYDGRYETMCWHCRFQWWYWKGIFFIMRIQQAPAELNKQMQQYMQELRNK